MGNVYLDDLADWLRAAGLTVVEYSGWQTRARSSGGYDTGRPWCVMWHHTASRASPQADADYCCKTSADKPISNLLVARDGAVWVLAAGATNTNGKGGPASFSRGTVPVDAMNTYAVSMEICNDGVGEAYPLAQIDAAFATSLALTGRLGLAPDDVYEHQPWAPTRKIDPALASAVAGAWRPAAMTTSGTWALADLRAECRRRASPLPPPPADDDGDVPRSLVRCGNRAADPSDTAWNAFVVFAGGKYWLPTNEALAQAKRDFGYDPIDVTDDWMRASGPVVPPCPTTDPWGAWTPLT